MPRLGDVIVRSQAGSARDAAFVVVEPVTDRFLSGPFKSLAEAVNSAKRRLAPDGRLWRQKVDRLGRSLGPTILMPALIR